MLTRNTKVSQTQGSGSQNFQQSQRRQSSAHKVGVPQSKLTNEGSSQHSSLVGSSTANANNLNVNKQRPVLRTQSRDKKTSVDPFKNLMTQVARDGSHAVPAPPVVQTPKSAALNKNSTNQMSIPLVDSAGMLGPKSRKNLTKKTLVLDLDETLVHSSFKPPEQPDIVLPVDIEGKICYVYVLVRPGAISFLEELSEYYELVIYTASLSKYAEPLMKILDQGEWCSYLLFREHCTFYNGIFVKDMTQLGRNVKDIIIIDNSPSSYLFQPENAMPILSWYDDKSDQYLYDYLPILKELADVDDVRPFLMAAVKDNILDIDKALNLVKTYKDQIQQNLAKSKFGSVHGTENNNSETTASITNSTNKLPIECGSKMNPSQYKSDPYQDSKLQDEVIDEIVNSMKSKTKITKLPVSHITKQVSKEREKKMSMKPQQVQQQVSQTAKRFIQSAKQKVQQEVKDYQAGPIDNIDLGQDKTKRKRPQTTSTDKTKSQIEKIGNKRSSKNSQNNLNLYLSKQKQQSDQQASYESTPQQTPDLEFVDRVAVGPVQLINYSQKTKLISEISTNSLTREQIMNVKNKNGSSQPEIQKAIKQSYVIRNENSKLLQNQTSTTNGQETTQNSTINQNERKKSITQHQQQQTSSQLPKNSSLNRRSNRMMMNTSSNQPSLEHHIKASSFKGKIGLQINETSPLRQRENHFSGMSQSTKYSDSRKFVQQAQQTPIKQSSQSVRNLESNCDVPREDGVVQKVHISETSINRTPKSEIHQPGRLFESSATRGTSTSQKNNAYQDSSSSRKMDQSEINIQVQPKIMNFNSRFSSKKQDQSLACEETSNLNIFKQKIDFKNIEINDQSYNSQISPTNNLSIFKFNSPKNPQFINNDHLRQFSIPNFGNTLKNTEKVDLSESSQSNIVMLHKTQLISHKNNLRTVGNGRTANNAYKSNNKTSNQL